MTIKIRTGSAALALALAASAAAAEPMKLEGTVTDIVGQRLIVRADTGKILVDLGPEANGQTAIKEGDKVVVDGDMKKDSQLKAVTVTANGQTYQLEEGKSWMEWLTGKKKDEDMGSYSATDAKKIAEGKGYALTSEPTPDKKHYVATATKDGKTFELDIHKDGNIVAETAFGITDAKKVAADNGYTLTSEPVQEKKHFTAKGTKDGKSYDLDIHRDGTVKEDIAFSAVDAKKLATDKGYQVVGDAQPEKKHFQMLGKKDGKYYAVDAHADGSVKELRTVDKSDIRWGPMIQ